MPSGNRADRDAVKIAGQELYGRIQAVMERIDWGSFLKLTDMLPDYRRTFLTGAGRSGLVARMFGMRLMHAGLTAYVTGETITPAAGRGDLLVAISCTGATGYTEYLVRRAKGLGARVVVITSEAGSPLAGLGDDVVIGPATAEDIVTRAAVFEHATPLSGDAAACGRALARQLRDGPAGVYLWGGETSVRLPARPGRGGRNQHLALAAATVLAGAERCSLLCAGTDGSDGRGEDAGAIVDGGTLRRGQRQGLNADEALCRADSGRFLRASGDLLRTGPTGTNVMDVVVGIKHA